MVRRQHRNKCFSIFLWLCTKLTFDLILRHRDIFRHGIHPYRFYYTYNNIFCMDASFYPILPSEVFFSWNWQPTNIDNPYFEGMVNQICPPELQLNKANTSNTEAPFFDLHLFISNGSVSSKIYDKRDDFDFHIVNFPFLDGDVPRRPSYGVYVSHLIRFARACSHFDDFNTCNKYLTAKQLPTRLAICFRCILSVCDFGYFPFWFWGWDLPSDCSSSCSLLFHYFYQSHKLRVLLPTQWIGYKIQCRVKTTFTTRPIGTRIYGDLVYKFKN